MIDVNPRKSSVKKNVNVKFSSLIVIVERTCIRTDICIVCEIGRAENVQIIFSRVAFSLALHGTVHRTVTRRVYFQWIDS